jgi:hypothetical protein
MNAFAKKMIVAVFFLATASMAATPPQTVKDSMNGNWTVINGKKLFLSGMNLAWLSSSSFGNDVGDVNINIDLFTDKVKKIRQAGGNSLRWWLSTDASNDPKIDTNGVVTGLGAKTIANMRQALDTAYAYGVVVSMCLFSYDLLVPGTKASYSGYNLASNYKFLTVPANIDTYLNNALKPMLDSVGSHPAVMCWEVFNEPENMLDSTATMPDKITQNDILRITNKIAGFIHRNSKKMATTGITSFQYRGQYSKSKLIAAGADSAGYLDFYMVHYDPEYQADSLSPFSQPASSWGMDKPVMAGRFPAASWSTSMIGPSSGLPLKSSETINNAFSYAYSNGYAGALSWTMTNDSTSLLGYYGTTAPALQALFAADSSNIMIKNVVIVAMTGNYVMKVDLKNIPAANGSANYFELGSSASANFSGKTNFIFDMFVKPGSSTNLQITPVLKVTSAYTWSPANTNLITLGNVKQGVWVTDTVPIANFNAPGDTDVREMLFQWSAQSVPYDSGDIYFDNFRIDNDTLANFNIAGTTWSTTAGGAIVSLVPYSDVPVQSTMDTNNYVMMLDLKNIPAPNGATNYFELGASLSKVDLTGKTNLIFDMYIKPGSSTGLQMIPVLKVDSTYTWSAATGSTLYLNMPPQGQWFSDTVLIANFYAPSVKDVRQVLFQWSTTGSPYDSGDIYFDNFRADNDTLFNFNTPGITWSVNAPGAKLSLVKYSDVMGSSAVKNKKFGRLSLLPEFAVHDKTMFLRLHQALDAKVTVFDLRGKTVGAVDCGRGAGLYTVSLKGLAAGPYIVEIGKGLNAVRSKFFLQ